jgi:hypothetical protein
MVVFTLEERIVKAPAADVVFDIVGHVNPDELVAANILSAGQLDDFKSFQQMIFDCDEQGPFIREGVSFRINNRELDPDSSLASAFVPAERQGVKYMRCDLVVVDTLQTGASTAPTAGTLEPAQNAASIQDQIREFARIFFLHQIAAGFEIDVTREFPELVDVVKYAESKGWIEVDVAKVAYKLTAEGKKVYDRYIAEAQDLIRRFDIYTDVDVDSRGTARFDTGLGKDLRVPAFEMEGVEPFRARFLLGLNDGEWNKLGDWMELFDNPDWYAGIFESIEQAPTVEDIGQERMASIIDQAKAELRQQSQPY